MENSVSILATQFDEVEGNAAWCPTMQICWETLLGRLNKGRPVEASQFGDGEGLVRNLNQKASHEGSTGSGHLYSYAGPKGIDDRQRIEQALMDMFGQCGDILDAVEWSEHPDPSALLFYSMLYSKFDFWAPFYRDDEREPGYEGGFFGSRANGNEAAHVHYFGTRYDWSASCDWDRETAMWQQLWVLFHDGDEANAVAISSRTGDMLILAKGLRGRTFAEMWDDLVARIPPYDDVLRGYEDGTRAFKKSTLECPMLSTAISRQYGELEQVFAASDGRPYSIATALQTFSLSLDATGCEVKSEALLDTAATGCYFEPPKKPPMPERNFVYDNEFVLFAVAMQERRNWGSDTRGHAQLMDVVRRSEGGTVQLYAGYDEKVLGVPFPATLAPAYPYVALHVSDIVEFQQGALHAERTDGGPRRGPVDPPLQPTHGDLGSYF